MTASSAGTFELDRWLEEVQASGVKLGLERIEAALEMTGRPQEHRPSLLVGGTNGKGSVVAFATQLLRAGGSSVGSTLSPHLFAYRERFRLDGEIVDRATLERVASSVYGQVAGQPGMESLTFFELGALLAMNLFEDCGVDVAVLEVGMGGEFDATRACKPRVAALVTVDLDHEKYLGTTVEAIARTKARIAPPGGVLVTTEVRADRLAVIREECAAVGCSLKVALEDFEWDFRDGELTYRSPNLFVEGVRLGLQGAHQGLNAACALAATEQFCAVAGLSPPDPWQTADALARTRLAGRLERARAGGPAFLLDGAHNPAGAEALAAALAERRRPRERVWLLASMQEKRRAAMLESLLPHVDRVVCTRGTSSPRFEDPETLAEELRAAGARAEAVPTVAEAVAALKRGLGSRDEVLVAGSLYLVGDVRSELGLPLA